MRKGATASGAGPRAESAVRASAVFGALGDLAVARFRSMYCRTCRYPLVQLTSRRCPECGRAFDPHDPRTFLRRPRFPLTQRFALVIHVGVLAMMLVFVLASATVSSLGRDVAGAFPNGSLIFGGSVLAAMGIALCDLRWLRDRGLAPTCLTCDAAALALWVWLSVQWG